MTSEWLRFFKIGLEGAENEDDRDVERDRCMSGSEMAGEMGSKLRFVKELPIVPPCDCSGP
jgi:hypothetical protein